VVRIFDEQKTNPTIYFVILEVEMSPTPRVKPAKITNPPVDTTTVSKRISAGMHPSHQLDQDEKQDNLNFDIDLKKHLNPLIDNSMYISINQKQILLLNW
jgi:hypothetical protein